MQAQKRLGQGDVDGAMRDFRFLYEWPVTPSSLRFHAAWMPAVYYMTEGDYENALAEVGRASAYAYDDQTRLLSSRSIASVARLCGRYAESEQAARSWLEHDPAPLAYVSLATALKNLGRLSDAIEVLFDGMKAAPEVADLPLIHAGYLHHRGDPADGARRFAAVQAAIERGEMRALDPLGLRINQAWYWAVARDQVRFRNELVGVVDALDDHAWARNLAAYLRVEADFAPYREESWFGDVVARVDVLRRISTGGS